jgi:AbrB family looped-hinge helix DNA binding protein
LANSASIITSRGQTTIPKDVRDRLHLKPGDRIEYVVRDDGTALMVPVTAPVTSLRGVLPSPPEPVTLEGMDRAIRRRTRRK